jgi:hypothetical protein
LEWRTGGVGDVDQCRHRAADQVAGRLVLQPVYPQLQKYPCATAVTLGASKGHPEDDCVAAMPLPISPHPCCSRSSEKKVCRAPHVQTNDELLDCARTTARTLRR